MNTFIESFWNGNSRWQTKRPCRFRSGEDGGPPIILSQRLEKEKPVVEGFLSWLDQQNPTRGSRMDKAVTYIQNRRSYLSTYLEDGRCSFSNNLSENAIRPFTVGRKNWLFCDTPNGAQASAVVYTMVEMAKANGVNVYHYLTYLLEKLPDDRMSDDDLELQLFLACIRNCFKELTSAVCKTADQDNIIDLAGIVGSDTTKDIIYKN